MNEADLKHLTDYAASYAKGAVKTRVRRDDSGGVEVEAISVAGGGAPRSVIRSADFTTREAAEELVRNVVDTARAH